VSIQAMARAAADKADHEIAPGELRYAQWHRDAVADAVAVAVLREVERHGADRWGAGTTARRLLRQFEAPAVSASSPAVGTETPCAKFASSETDASACKQCGWDEESHYARTVGNASPVSSSAIGSVRSEAPEHSSSIRDQVIRAGEDGYRFADEPYRDAYARSSIAAALCALRAAKARIESHIADKAWDQRLMDIEQIDTLIAELEP